METRFVTAQLRGTEYVAVCLELNTQHYPQQLYWEESQRGIGIYTTEREADEEAQNWAWTEDLAYVAAIDADVHRFRTTQQWRINQLQSG